MFFPPQEDEEPPDCRYAVNQLKCPATLEIPTLCELKRGWMVYSDTIQTPSARAIHQPPLRYNARVLFFYFMWFVTARASLFVHLVGSQTVWSCLNFLADSQLYTFMTAIRKKPFPKKRHPKRWIMQFLFHLFTQPSFEKRSILRIFIIFIISSTKFCNKTMRF